VRFEATYRMYWCVHEQRSKEYLEPLLGALRDPELRVRIWACGALGKLGDAGAVPALLRALEDPEVFVRYRAAEALGLLRAAEAEEPLLRMAREDWWYCGMYALTALRRIRPEKY
jgi:HEAT repeat protein